MNSNFQNIETNHRDSDNFCMKAISERAGFSSRAVY